MSTSSTLEIYLLGPFRVAVNGQVVGEQRWSRRKPALLIKLLALDPHHQLHREQVMELLWPELEPEAASNNLHKAIHQAARNITGAQQGPPAPPEVIADIAAFEESLSTAQLIVPGVGRLDADGARGGPEELSKMTQPAAGRFDLYDAWSNDPNPRRAQIFRGQELFNARNTGGGSCNGCHNSSNNGTNTRNLFFDIGAASALARTRISRSILFVTEPRARFVT